MNLSFRETLRRYVPPWLSDRPSSGRTAGFRYLYGLVAILDAGMQFMVEGMQARLPGIGTPTALPYIGRDRRIIRGPHETDADYAARLLEWLDLWRAAGNAYALAKALQAFLAPGHPRIRIVTRSGFWWTLEPTGELTWHLASPNNSDWDSHTHPENAGRWGDFWVVVYPPHFPDDGLWGDGASLWGGRGTFGQDTTTANAEAIRALVRQWKAAHSRCVALIFAYDPRASTPPRRPARRGCPMAGGATGPRTTARAAASAHGALTRGSGRSDMQYAGQEQFPQSFELVADNTGRDGASVDVGLEALADRTVYLRARGYAGIQSWSYSTEGPPVIGVSIWPFNTTAYAPNTLDPNALAVTFPDTRVGDEFAIDFYGNTFCTPASGVEAFLAVHATDNLGSGAETKVPSAMWRYGISGTMPPAVLTGRWTAQAAGTTRFRLLGRVSAQGPSFGVAAVASLRVLRFRPK